MMPTRQRTRDICLKAYGEFLKEHMGKPRTQEHEVELFAKMIDAVARDIEARLDAKG